MVVLQETLCFTIEEQFHRLLVTSEATFEPNTLGPDDLHLLQELHITTELTDEDCKLLIAILPSSSHLTSLMLDASATSPGRALDHHAACIDGGGVAENLAACMSRMHWLRHLTLRWPMHGVVPIAAVLPALESLQDLSLRGPSPGLSGVGVSMVARGLPTVTGLQRYTPTTAQSLEPL